MPEQLSISAVIPAYNAEAFVAEAIESALNQSRPPKEILVVDDCSTDQTVQIASAFPVKVICLSENSGHAVARNLAIENVSNPLIAWLDADDVWNRDHLEEVAGLLDADERVGVACSPVEMFGERSGIRDCIYTDRKSVNAFDACFSGTCIPAMSAVTRTADVRMVGGFDASYRTAPDFDFWLRLSTRTQFASTPRVTARYRWHGGQISSASAHSLISARQYRAIYRARSEFLNHADACKLGVDVVAYWRKANALLIRDAKIAALAGNRDLIHELQEIGQEFLPLDQKTKWFLKLLKWSPRSANRLAAEFRNLLRPNRKTCRNLESKLGAS
ncbi:glycosyltransferase [Stieleria sp. TO1_6]|uniref:glycosyltransferase family 2 protein n=1 Tax=Stieleria tagensis TaxID=2956795 RepID=UPI00209B33D9|nr:glycosyltransferase family 2 protein [Stieleria tagensis]MCO8123445.1 glycosyltransferase [Stieleria tagensis]